MFKIKKRRSKKYNECLGKSLFVIIFLGFIVRYLIELIRGINRFIKGDATWFTYFNIPISTLIIILCGISCYIVAIGKFKQNIFFAVFGIILVYEIVVLTITESIGHRFISSILLLSIYLFFIWWGGKINSKNEKKPEVLSKK